MCSLTGTAKEAVCTDVTSPNAASHVLHFIQTHFLHFHRPSNRTLDFLRRSNWLFVWTFAVNNFSYASLRKMRRCFASATTTLPRRSAAHGCTKFRFLPCLQRRGRVSWNEGCLLKGDLSTRQSASRVQPGSPNCDVPCLMNGSLRDRHDTLPLLLKALARTHTMYPRRKSIAQFSSNSYIMCVTGFCFIYHGKCRGEDSFISGWLGGVRNLFENWIPPPPT